MARRYLQRQRQRRRRRAARRGRSFRTLLVGLGAGSCASAVSSLLEASSDQIDADVVVVENDEAVLEAARTVHGLRIHREGTAPRTLARGQSIHIVDVEKDEDEGDCAASSHRSSAGGVRVVLSDAADFMASIQPASVDCILLDAYDAKGNVCQPISKPSHSWQRSGPRSRPVAGDRQSVEWYAGGARAIDRVRGTPSPRDRRRPFWTSCRRTREEPNPRGA